MALPGCRRWHAAWSFLFNNPDMAWLMPEVPMMNLVYGVLAIALGITSLFLASANQNWRSRPLPRTAARLLALALLLVGLLCLCAVFQLLSAVFVFISLSMLLLQLCPYLGVLRRSGRAG
jgi:hypothetical protein